VPFQASQVATVQTQQPQQQPQKVPDRTGGGCRVIPYEDMSNKMSSLFSGRRI
jgi:hypothetical protein